VHRNVGFENKSLSVCFGFLDTSYHSKLTIQVESTGMGALTIILH